MLCVSRETETTWQSLESSQMTFLPVLECRSYRYTNTTAKMVRERSQCPINALILHLILTNCFLEAPSARPRASLCTSLSYHSLERTPSDSYTVQLRHIPPRRPPASSSPPKTRSPVCSHTQARQVPSDMRQSRSRARGRRGATPAGDAASSRCTQLVLFKVRS